MGALLVLSALFAGSETAFFSLARGDLRKLREEGTVLPALIVRLRMKPRTLLVSVLLGNLAVNVGFFSIAAGVSGRFAAVGSRSGAVAFGGAALLILILFGEFLPKGVALRRPVRAARVSAFPIFAFGQAILPVRFLLDRLVGLVSQVLGGKALSAPYVTAEELKAFVRLSGATGRIGAGEREMLQDVIDLREIRLREVMIPRVDMVAVDLSEGREGILRASREKRVSKIVIFDGSLDRVLGFVAAMDLLYFPEEDPGALLRTIPSVPETKSAESLLREFRAEGEPLALVVDEYGGTEGIVTPEDILEEVVGEIADEHEPERGRMHQIAHGSWLVAGETSLRDWEERSGTPLPAGRFATVGGFVLSTLDRLPAPGDVVLGGGYRFTILSVRGGRILGVLAHRLPGQGEP